ncbi:hypothetical protein V4V55_003692 [Vibrio mimicus]
MAFDVCLCDASA